MALNFVYPTTAELREIAQDLIPRLTQDRPIFQILPRDESQDFYVAWEQMDNYFGLQHVRGLDGAPGRVQSQGGKRFLMRPGVYGDVMTLTEEELTVSTRQWGTWNQRLDLSEIILRKQNLLLGRELDRIELIGWTLLTTGTFAVSDATGGVLHTDIYSPQVYTGSNWMNPATGTPLHDLRSAQLLRRGHSVSFGPSATTYINQSTANALLENRNPADLGGQLTVSMNQVYPTLRSLEVINQYLGGQGLPQFSVYDEFYLDDDQRVQLYIPNGKGVLIGQRPAGQQVGSYRMVRNANNPDMAAGSYSKVVDHADQKVPRTIDVHQGHNGGPTLSYPSAVVVLNIGA